ncbi:MAG: MbnH family di-heme enzyme [Acidobacteriota bacterium]
MSAAKVELGRWLFYDTRLSRDGSMSCATCHRQDLAFTDGRGRALGVTGELHPRGAMSLANVAYAVSLGWDDPDLDRLEDQLTTPIFGHDPVEMGLRSREPLVDALRGDWRVALLFAAAFPADPEPVTFENLAFALASFQRTLISGGSAFDRYMYGDDPAALAPAERRGMRLYFSRRLGCSECHGRFTFSGPIQFEGSRDHLPLMHNTGLYNLGPKGAYPEDSWGLMRHTRRPQDMGKFKAPSLRNIEVTAPYMHDGSVETLGEAIDHYAAGGRTIGSGPYAGRGADSPRKSEDLTGFTLEPEEKADLLAFLRALTDHAFLEDPRFADPRPTAERSPQPPEVSPLNGGIH